MDAQTEYNILLRGGDLLEMFPKLSGQWERDKKVFTKIYEDNQKILDMDVVIDDDDEYYGEDY